MSLIQKVAVLGVGEAIYFHSFSFSSFHRVFNQILTFIQASGNLGQSIIPSLLQSGFTVTIIARPGGRSYTPPVTNSSTDTQAIQHKEAAYDDIAALTAALHDQDALIEAFHTNGAVHQRTIVRAALAAGVKHLITSEFGLDTFHANAGHMPISTVKIEAQRVLEEELQLAVKDGNAAPLAWTAIFVGIWYDWGIRTGGSWVDPPTRTIRRLGSGNQKVSMSRIAVNGEAVVTVLRKPELFRNRPAYFASHTVSINELIALVREVSEDTDKGWTVVDVPSVDAVKSAGLHLWETDGENGVQDQLHTQAFMTLAAAALYDENNTFGADFGKNLEAGWDEGREKLKDNLKLLIEEATV
jgi:hypothetical protein